VKTLLVLAQHPDLAQSMRAGLNSEEYRVLDRYSLEEAEPFLVHGLMDACILELDLTTVQGIWMVEKLRRRAPKCPLILYTGAGQSQWEEEAYVLGATHVLAKPVRPRMLAALLARLWPEPGAAPHAPFSSQPPLPQGPIQPMEPAPVPVASAAQTLGVLRDFSGILTQSLNAEGMLKQFLLLLREILGLNRAAIFLRPPFASLGGPQVFAESRQLRAACSLGLSAGLLQHFELSFEAGIGGQLLRLGRILRRQSEEARSDPATQKEFELLGVEVAVPVLDRENVLGVAVFDGRVTGEPLVNSELELVFHLLEQLGLALKNIWLHDQLVSNHEMMADILRELSSACVVVSRDLAVLHANKMARKHFSRSERQKGELEFNDLPQVLGTKIYQVLRTGAAVSNFKFKPGDGSGAVLNANIVPFQRQQPGLPAAALLMVEDITQSEQLQRLEIETAKLRLVKTMADRLTHEIGNALVSLSVHQQMLAEKLGASSVDLEFLQTMECDLAEGVRRVTRLTNQMRFLARDSLVAQEAFALGPLLEDAYQEARRYQPAKNSQLKYDTGNKPIILTGDRPALKHALAEVMLNALQANPSEPRIDVHLRAEQVADGNGGQLGLQIEVEDNGPGFTADSAEKASIPFFTTRNVGLGLGLTVSRKIIETHRGKLEIVTPRSNHSGIIRISLPLETTNAQTA
jgi:signal transduction histidine kinase/ActR/RegA family two-component response regulator